MKPKAAGLKRKVVRYEFPSTSSALSISYSIFFI